MEDFVDILHQEGLRDRQAEPRRFLSVWYRCCHAYGRMYPNRQRTAFEGRCPRCGAKVRARIGPEGSARRSFEAT